MRRQLLDRRVKMLNYLSKQIPIGTIATDLAHEYNVNINAIYQDHHRLTQWAPQVLQLQDDTLAYELVNNIKEVIPNAWFEYKQADNSNAKIGALRLIMDSTVKLIEILQKLGKMEKVIEVTQINLKWLNDESENNNNPV